MLCWPVTDAVAAELAVPPGELVLGVGLFGVVGRVVPQGPRELSGVPKGF